MPMRLPAALTAMVLLLAAAAVPCVALARAEKGAPVAAAGSLYVSQVTLTGKAAKPRGEAGGTGSVMICIDKAAGSISYGFLGLFVTGRPTGGHIHRGAVGVSGPVVFSFAAPGMVDPLVGEVQWGGTAKPSKSTIASLIGRARGYYVDVHTPTRPKGAVRGQLGPWKRVPVGNELAIVCGAG
jgi:hypothetical protein